jgi:hypothetical protein
MNEFGATLVSFIKRAGFESQSEYATAAKLQAPNVTRALSGDSFSTSLLAKFISPFKQPEQVELIRAFLRDRLAESKVGEGLVSAVFSQSADPFADLPPELRLLLQRLAGALREDEKFQHTLESLLALVDEDTSRKNLRLVAEPKGKWPGPPPGRSQAPSA